MSMKPVWKLMLGTAILAHANCGVWAATPPADTYPSKPIRLIVGFTPGGSDDYVGRIVGARVTERLGQTVIVDNRPGAGGNIGAEITARANPDGYTLSSVGSITLASGPSLYAKLGYDPMKDFSFISRVAIGANVLVATPSLPAKSVKELVALARAQPRSIRYGTPGVASLGHLAMELLQNHTQLQLVHVPYKGPAPAIAAVVGGEVQIAVGASTAAVPMIQAKRVNALAVTSANRLGALPGVPTVAESGFPGFEVTNNHGILAPAGTPVSVVRLLNAEIRSLLQMEDVKAKFPALGLEAAGSTPEEFRDIVKAELARWTRVIKDANISAN
jgi:tripartite-type tricarboxylate transporter receptor subunit TctC